MSVSKDRDVVFTGSHDGFVISWDVATGENQRIAGAGHGNQMNGMITIGESVFTCGIDDAVKEINTVTKSFTNTNIKLGSQPRGLAGSGSTLIVPCEKEVHLFVLRWLPVSRHFFRIVGGFFPLQLHIYEIQF